MTDNNRNYDENQTKRFDNVAAENRDLNDQGSFDDQSNFGLNYNREEPQDFNESSNRNYEEETASEITAPIYGDRERTRDERGDDQTAGRGVGYTALVISILSLFIMPVFLGTIGIIVGFVARGRGAVGLGSWAIGIGAVAVILRLFFAPLTNFTFM